MKITRISMKPLEIPFKVAFKHASAERVVTEAVITTVESARGYLGYGEGCPRHYVTHESVDSAHQFFSDIKSMMTDTDSITSLQVWVTQHQQQIDANPAAWCSIETAILDVLGKEAEQSVDELFGLPILSGIFKYSAVLGVATRTAFQAQLKQYNHLGMSDFKLKLCGQYEIDKCNVDDLANLPNSKIRVDANNLWSSVDEAFDYIKSLNYPFWAIEEPLQVADYKGLSELALRLNTSIILDESFLRIAQFDELAVYPIPWIINIRISKMGGIIRALQIAQEAQHRDFKFVIGAQVGETSILTRAALTLANANRQHLLAQEGAFGTYLLERDLVERPIMFGKNGEVAAESIAGSGLGLVMLPDIV